MKSPNDVLKTPNLKKQKLYPTCKNPKCPYFVFVVPILPKKNVEFTWHFFLPPQKKDGILNCFQLQKPDPPTSKIPAAKANVTNHGHNTRPINELGSRVLSPKQSAKHPEMLPCSKTCYHEASKRPKFYGIRISGKIGEI